MEPAGRSGRLAVPLPARSEPRQRALRRELAAEEVGSGRASLRELVVVVVVLLVLVVVEMAENGDDRKEQPACPMEIPTATIAVEMSSGWSTGRRYVGSYRREHHRCRHHRRQTRIIFPSTNDVS